MEAARYIEGHGRELPLFEVENLESRRSHWEHRRDEGETIVCRAEEVLGKIAIPGQLLLPLHEVADGSPKVVDSTGTSPQRSATI